MSSTIISFQITHPFENLDRIPLVFKKPPFRIWQVGEKRITPKGKSLGGFHKNSYCCIRLESSQNLDVISHIQNTLDLMTKDSKYWERLISSGGKYHLTLFSDRGTFAADINWQLLSELSKFHISLSFDVGSNNGQT